MRKVLFVLLALSLSACGVAAAPTALPTYTLYPTYTPYPTAPSTSTPTSTPTSTRTPTVAPTITSTPDTCSLEAVGQYSKTIKDTWLPIHDTWQRVQRQAGKYNLAGVQAELWEYIGAVNEADRTLRPMTVPECLFSSHSWYLRSLPEYSMAAQNVSDAIDTDNPNDFYKFLDRASNHWETADYYMDRGDRMLPKGF